VTRDDQVRKALKLLKPANRKECTDYLHQALDDLAITKAENQRESEIASKESRKALDVFRKALTRAIDKHKRLPVGLQETLEAGGRIGGRHGMDDLVGLIRHCDKLLALRPRSQKDYIKKNAAAWAKNILDLLSIESPLTHDGKWPRLAAILHGEASSSDLFHHCSEYKSSSGNGGRK
jgi:hypothetical protein